MSLKRDTLKTELRSRLGDPSVAELPDTQVEFALDSALREFSRFRPKMDAILLSLNEGQSVYELPLGAVGVADFWVLPLIGRQLDDVFDPAMLLLGRNITGLSFSNLQALGFVLVEELVWDWDVEQRVDESGADSTPVLKIHPAPDFNSQAFIRTESPRTFDSLAASDAEAILLWAQGECLEYIGRRRSKSVTKIPTAAGQLTLNTGYNERIDGRQFKKDFRNLMGQGASVVTKG